MTDDAIDVRSLVGLFRRRLKLILATVVTCLALSSLYLFTQTPLYTARTLILVDPRQKNLMDPAGAATYSQGDNARVESEVEILKAPSTLLAVIDGQSLVADPEFGVKLGLKDRLTAMLGLNEKPADPAKSDRDGAEQLQGVLDRFTQAVSISRLRLTYVIGVGVSSADPEKAARLANALAASYIRQQLEAKVAYTVEGRDALRRRLSQAAEDINAVEARIDQFVATNAAGLQGATPEIAALQGQLQALSERSAAMAGLATSVGRLAEQADWVTVADKLQSDAVKQLDERRRALAAQFADTKDGSAQSVDLRMQLAKLDRQLTDTVNDELERLRRQTEATQGEQDRLRERIRGAIMASDMPKDLLVRLYQLQQEADVSRSQYQEILQRLRQMEAEADLQVPDSRIVSAATPPDSPTSPRIRLMLMASTVVAVGLGVAFAFLMENYIGGFSSPEQTESVLGVRAASVIPTVAPSRYRGRPAVVEEILANPLSAYSEAIRLLRMALENRLPALGDRAGDGKDRTGVVVLVTSALPAEGKTTTSLALARSFSLGGRSTLLLDCDLRRPSVAPAMGLHAEEGLLDFLTDRNSPPPLGRIIATDEPSDLRVIAGGKRSTVPTDQLLRSDRFHTLLDVARQKFEVVVIDTPPVLLVNDALYLAKLADVAVLAVRWSSTSQRDVRAGLQALESARPDIFPPVLALTQAELSATGYARRYGEYYSLGTA